MRSVPPFALLMLMLLLNPPASVLAADIEPSRQFAAFLYTPSAEELTAVRKYWPDKLTLAENSGRPFIISVARVGGTVLISLESVAVCTRLKACPLLVFRDIAKPPVLNSFAFQNVVIEYRPKGTFLVMRVWEKVTECLISIGSRAKCNEVKPAPHKP